VSAFHAHQTDQSLHKAEIFVTGIVRQAADTEPAGSVTRTASMIMVYVDAVTRWQVARVQPPRQRTGTDPADGIVQPTESELS
jgi:hypothetical protein